MCNKTLQKLHGTNAVIGFSSGLISVKLSATEISLVPVGIPTLSLLLKFILNQALVAAGSSWGT